MVPIHGFAGIPLGRTGLASDVGFGMFSVHPGERFLQGRGFWSGEVLKSLCSSIFEPDLTIRALLAVETTFMNEVMMVSAEQNQVVETRFTPIGPVNNVVTVDEPVV